MTKKQDQLDHFAHNPALGLTGSKLISTRKVIVPAGFKERLKAPHVHALARTLSGMRQINGIAVRKPEPGKGFRLIAGGDRLAASMILGRRKVFASIWEVSDREAYEMQLHENASRRHNPGERAALRQKLLDLYSEEYPGTGESGPTERTDRPDDVTPPEPEEPSQKEIVERIAQAMNIKPDSVKRAERRARAKERRGDKPPTRRALESQAGKDAKPIGTLGIVLTGDFMNTAEKLRNELWTAGDLIKRGQGVLAKAAKNPLAYPSALLALHEKMRALASAIRATCPASICPYCKVLDGLLDNCDQCHGTGLVTSEQLAGAPRELLITGDRAKVTYGGRWYTATEWQTQMAKHQDPVPASDERAPQTSDWEALQ